MLRDAVNNDVEIVRYADTCLVFTDPLPPHGLTWRQMVAWWTNNHQPDADEKSAADALYRRLYRSLDSPPEQLLMITYCARHAEEGGFDLPALIPQVYLHYDPYTRRSGKQSGALYRQRMDFLLLAPDRSRIVIEVDGVQHYGRPNLPDEQGRVHTAVPQLYAEMVAEDRRLRLAGYEIYRFGGWELTARRWEAAPGGLFSPNSSPGTRSRRCEPALRPAHERRCRMARAVRPGIGARRSAAGVSVAGGIIAWGVCEAGGRLWRWSGIGSGSRGSTRSSKRWCTACTTRQRVWRR
ncbi:hypothetical protein [Streptomyces violaceus]|uniref:AbiJ-NTD3 domain-containing protein n=1 Tax=Streptomyces violaceus TaxID=1936 RepID=A0ABY9U0V6_STRVL|nr:hypothetical protein [Streptomyces janthinus]WND15867.1 hypothetical protein RI060_00050 [Streptomyces janthinus]